MRILINLLALPIICMACSNTPSKGQGQTENEAETIVEGTIANGAGKPLYLQKLSTASIENVDTLTIEEDGGFSFALDIDQPAFYRLMLAENNFMILVVDEDDHVKVEADASSLFQTYSTEGSPETDRMKELSEILAPRDSLNMAMQQARVTQNLQAYQQAMMEQQNIMGDLRTQVIAFIDRDPGSLSSLAAVQNLDIEQDFPVYEKVANGLAKTAPETQYYQQLQQNVDQLKTLAVGSVAPDINLPRPNGELLALSSLQGNYVLIDFWASWCRPCRMENPNVVRVYNKYKDKGFEIYGVSLDQNEGAWKAAIEQDKLTWKHVSDLKYWKSSVVPLYGIKGIPMTVLLDKEGKIIAKNLRGEQLEQKLAEIFAE